MMFHLALLFAWKAAARDSCHTKALSMVQTKKAVSKMHMLEGKGLLHNTEDLTVVATQSSEAGAHKLYVQHASRSAQFQRANEKATQVLQAMKDKENNLVAQRHAATTPAPNLTANHAATTPAPNLTANHENRSAHFSQKVTDANATQCRECGNAEEALIAATRAALTAHTTAQAAAAFLSLAAKKYAMATQGFNAANDEYTRVLNQMSPITLTYTAAESAFDSLAIAVQDLKQKALIAQQHKAWETANKTVVDTARSQYDAAAARATAAERPIPAKEATAAAACASINMAQPTPMPPPTPPPTQAPALSDSLARHPCCLPNSVVRVLYPAGTLHAPASSIKLLIAKQRSYGVVYKGIAIGEQDGVGGNMKPGTIASFNNGANVGPVSRDTWTQELSYNIEVGKNYLISFMVVVGPDGWVEWDDQGKKVFIKDWDGASNVIAPVWSWKRTVSDKMYNIKAVQVH